MDLATIKKLGRVAVLMGGVTEREVSLEGGRAIYNAFAKQGVDVVAIEVDDDLIRPLLSEKIDRVFNVLHGGAGEGGTLQAILENLQIPYTDSSAAASMLALDKRRSKIIYHAAGIPVLKDCLVTADMSVQAIEAAVGFPFILKPVHGGSSVGTVIVREKENYTQAYQAASQVADDIMAETFIDGDEFTVGILGDLALPVIRIKAKDGFYDYQAKYLEDSTVYLMGDDAAPKKVRQLCQTYALQAFHALGCRYWGRVDFMLDKQQNLYILEVNTVTGMSSHSCVPKAAQAINLSFTDLVNRVLLMTLK